MADPNPMAVIADCIEKSKATTDQELIGDYIAEALGVLQIDNTEDDAFNMLGSAIVDAVADDTGHFAACLDLHRKSGEFPVSNEELDDAAATVYEGICG
jgi:hypothetical protein